QNFRYLWVVIVPLAFTAVITITASMYKIFSPNPAVGYWANHVAFRDALASGATSHGTAGTVEAMEAVVRNTFIQGSLSILFVTLAIIVIISATIATLRSRRSGLVVDTDDPATPSRTFAPAGFLATANEKALDREWAKRPELRDGIGGGGH
ncbi:carbon starvation protein A, partial [Leucobacter sp. M11]|nr:carbon starvation protein A [Leucobacter sp. M11]